jgi:hypothetical protein
MVQAARIQTGVSRKRRIYSPLGSITSLRLLGSGGKRASCPPESPCSPSRTAAMMGRHTRHEESSAREGSKIFQIRGSFGLWYYLQERPGWRPIRAL